MPSDAFTESSQASSNDGGAADTTQRLNGFGSSNGMGNGNGNGNGNGIGYGRHHKTNLSMSSMSAVSETGDRTDQLFALEEQPDT